MDHAGARGEDSRSPTLLRFTRRTELPVPAEAAAAWHARPGALERLIPPFSGVRAVGPPRALAEGSQRELEVPVGPLRLRWVARHSSVRPDGFVDEQLRGPFARWVHEHGFRPGPSGRGTLEDDIRYALPGGALGRLLLRRSVTRALERTFSFRHRRTADDLARHAPRCEPLRVAITGSSGFVGSTLTAFLLSGGHEVLRLVRRAPGEGEARWDPRSGALAPASLEGLHAVVHLAGANIAGGRWTEARKRLIRDSRVEGTRLLAAALAACRRPPRVLVSASAIGFYGDSRDGEVDESSSAGTGFLADTCRAWEKATEPARVAGVRVVHLRTGVVLGAAGGALGRMLWPFRLGLGGRLGSGLQPMSWIALDDLVGLVHRLLVADDVDGPINAVAPCPVSAAGFAATLGRVMGRPASLPVPAAAIRLALGEMGQSLLLSGVAVRSRRLEEAGFRHLHPDLETALRRELGRPRGA